MKIAIFAAGVAVGLVLGAQMAPDEGEGVLDRIRKSMRRKDGAAPAVVGATYETIPATDEEARSVMHTRTDGM